MANEKPARDTSGDSRPRGRDRAGQDMGQPGTPTTGNPSGTYPFPDTSGR